MAEQSKIEWTDHTFNPWTGCTNISPGCDHCYAEAWSKRSGHVKWGNNPRKKTSIAYWRKPFSWHAKAADFMRVYGRRQRIFCASLADVFDNKADPAWRRELFEIIKLTPNLDWLVLSKRPENMDGMLPIDWSNGYSNVWLGVTAENQLFYNRRWKILRTIPARLKFISYEPAIGPLRLDSDDCPDWLIIGGESGNHARPVEPEWVTTVLSDCRRRGVTPFFKQWGTFSSNPLVRAGNASIAEARRLDPHGKGGGLIDNKIVREWPSTQDSGCEIAKVA